MINDDNYFKSKDLNYLIHKNKIQSQMKLDWQGYNFSEMERLLNFTQIFNKYDQDVKCNKKYLKNITNFKEKYSKVNKYIENNKIQCCHFQLHDILRAISQNNILYVSRNKIYSYNTSNGKSENIYKSNSRIYAFDFLKEKSIISGVLENNTIFLYNCKNKQKIDTDKIFKINNVIGRANFINLENSVNLLITGNALYAGLVDINKFPLNERKLKSQGNINNHDFCEKSKVVAFALENKKTEIFDLREKKSVLDFVSDQNYNLACKFIGVHKIVTSGEENLLKFWDLRSFEKPYQTVDNLVVSGHMEFVEKSNLLISLNVYGSIDFVKIEADHAFIDSFNYFGLGAGLCVTPGEGKCFATFNDILGYGRGGIFEFDIY